jgi:hypothetical protein
MSYQPNQLSFTQNSPLQQVGVALASASATSGSLIFGSSLFLDRVYVPGPMNLSEVDVAISLSMSSSATAGLWGSMNRQFVVYSFSNSTKLASLYSASQGITFNGSTTTTGASTAFSQVVGGWTAAGGVIVPMTFASSELPPGDYVFGNLIAFSGSTTASMSLYGAVANSMAAAQTVGAVTNTTQTVAKTIVTAIGSLATANAGNVGWMDSLGSSAASSMTTSFSLTQTVIQLPLLTSYASSAVTLNTAAPTALGSTTVNAATSVLPPFSYLGASSVLTGGLFFQPFQNGIMSTGAVPAAITLTTGTANALTVYGSTAAEQPWFAMVGA